MREQVTHQATTNDPRAPMPAAPMRYRPDGRVDWGNMWDSFCVLAREGGPPHRGEMLYGDLDANQEEVAYQAVIMELVRGVEEVSGLAAGAGPAGWLAIECASAGMAQWLSEAIREENVQARAAENTLFVPAGAHFTLKGEIKNVITAVAKTTHYWREHLPVDVKRTLGFQVRLQQWWRRLAGRYAHSPKPR